MYWIGVGQLFLWCIAYTAIWVIKDCRKPSAIGLSMAVGAWTTFLVFVGIESIMWLINHLQWVSQ